MLSSINDVTWRQMMLHLRCKRCCTSCKRLYKYKNRHIYSKNLKIVQLYVILLLRHNRIVFYRCGKILWKKVFSLFTHTITVEIVSQQWGITLFQCVLLLWGRTFLLQNAIHNMRCNFREIYNDCYEKF